MELPRSSNNPSPSHAHQSRPCYLLSLPPELRSIIYDHLFAPDSLLPLHIDQFPLRKEELEPALAQIPQLRHEVLPVYYSRVPCHITEKLGFRNFGLEAGLDLLGESSVRCLRQFRINCSRHFVVDVKLLDRVWQPVAEVDFDSVTCAWTGSRHMVTITQTSYRDAPNPKRRYAAKRFALGMSKMLSGHVERTLSPRESVYLSGDDIIMMIAEMRGGMVGLTSLFMD